MSISPSTINPPSSGMSSIFGSIAGFAAAGFATHLASRLVLDPKVSDFFSHPLKLYSAIGVSIFAARTCPDFSSHKTSYESEKVILAFTGACGISSAARHYYHGDNPWMVTRGLQTARISVLTVAGLTFLEYSIKK